MPPSCLSYHCPEWNSKAVFTSVKQAELQWISVSVSVVPLQPAKSKRKMEEDHKMPLEEMKLHQHFLWGD